MMSSEWAPESTLIQEVDDLFERAIESYRANPNLITEHANHEESIRVGGYSNRTLLELVQNAADAMSGASEHAAGAGRVEIVLDVDHQTLYCANDGRPFSKSGLTALAHAHLSAKRGDEIGRFGLGFKSVLAVTDAPQVFSRSISFDFNSRQAKAELEPIATDARRLPVLRTMARIDAGTEFAKDPILAELAEWAVTIVKLPNASKLENLKKEIEKFYSEFLLFVNAVREVRLRVIGKGQDFDTSHVSRDLGGGRFRIERPDDDYDDWYIENRMHEPSAEARSEVGEAVSRDQVKVTVAMPARITQRRTGEFWSYFPLQDKTSASALFNAPWSVNDDRTTLLRNTYNREILETLSKMFVGLLPRVSSGDDPAVHLDYMPARGRELLSFGDEIFCRRIPQMGSDSALIPDAMGSLCTPQELCPLDFAVSVSERYHEEWIASPNTGNNVPHWRCYATNQRATRLRQLYVHKFSSSVLEQRSRDELLALERMPKRGILSWLREWAEGNHLNSTVRAFAFVVANRNIDEVKLAKVVPTTNGLQSITDKGEVFLRQADGVDIEGASFVLPQFLEIPGIEKHLRDVGFRNLDPSSILQARLAKLSPDAGNDELSAFWDAAQEVPMTQALKIVSHDRSGSIKVPTQDGGWALPKQVFDIDGIGDGMPDRTLDRDRCALKVAHQAGVVHGPVTSYSVEDEIYFDDYREHVVDELNRRLGPGDRPIESVEFYKNDGPGPFSILMLLERAQASDQTREAWTRKLLELDKGEYWNCEDVDSQQTFRIISPVQWAAKRAGLLRSTRGYRPPGFIVSQSLVKYQDLLPLFNGPNPVEDALALPKALDDIPTEVLRESLESGLIPTRIPDRTLAEFVLAACELAFPDGRPTLIPARVGQEVEARRPDTVYLATTEEQRAFLSARHKPYLRVEEAHLVRFVEAVGCKLFEDSFSFSVDIEGRQEAEQVLDVYTGLRSTIVREKVAHASVARAIHIAKRVTTEDGVEDQSLPWHLEGQTLMVRADFGERRVLEIISEAFDLRLTPAEVTGVLKAGLDQHLEKQRQSACAAPDDAQRLEVFFGDDVLKENLPTGLWQALTAQGLVDDSTSVSKLFLTVWGGDSIRRLAPLFSDDGYTDVPKEWAGRASTIDWLRKMGFGTKYAGRRHQPQDDEFIVPGAVKLSPLHAFQERISQQLRDVLTLREADGRALKGMVELPTGAGKTRVATETVLRLFIEGSMNGPVLWIAQSIELCEQAVQTFSTVWRGLGDERPLTIGRLWENKTVHEPDTGFSVIVATDAKLEKVVGRPEYEWLRQASAVFIDEAHRAGSSTRYTQILKWLGIDGRNWKRPLVGLSATPFKGRADDDGPTRELAARFGNRKLQAFEFESNPYEELSRIGVLAHVKHEILQGIDVELAPEELDQARRWRKLEPGVLDRIGRDQARMKALVNHILSQDPEWPILVFTPNVLSAQVLAATLRYREIPATAVSGQTGRQQRRDDIEKFKSGEIRVLANCDLLIQGFDAPGVRALYIARPTLSPSAYIQMAGRGLRGPANGGKEECLIVDIADSFGAVNDFLGYREYEHLWKKQGS